jgi:hypothetical protein
MGALGFEKRADGFETPADGCESPADGFESRTQTIDAPAVTFVIAAHETGAGTQRSASGTQEARGAAHDPWTTTQWVISRLMSVSPSARDRPIRRRHPAAPILRPGSGRHGTDRQSGLAHGCLGYRPLSHLGAAIMHLSVPPHLDGIRSAAVRRESSVTPCQAVGEEDDAGRERHRARESQDPHFHRAVEHPRAAPQHAGWTMRRYSSIRPCCISVCTSRRLPATRSPDQLPSSPLAIQGVPYRSTSMPNASAQNVFWSGMTIRRRRPARRTPASPRRRSGRSPRLRTRSSPG